MTGRGHTEEIMTGRGHTEESMTGRGHTEECHPVPRYIRTYIHSYVLVQIVPLTHSGAFPASRHTMALSIKFY